MAKEITFQREKFKNDFDFEAAQKIKEAMVLPNFPDARHMDYGQTRYKNGYDEVRNELLSDIAYNGLSPDLIEQIASHDVAYWRGTLLLEAEKYKEAVDRKDNFTIDLHDKNMDYMHGMIRAYEDLIDTVTTIKEQELQTNQTFDEAIQEAMAEQEPRELSESEHEVIEDLRARGEEEAANVAQTILERPVIDAQAKDSIEELRIIEDSINETDKLLEEIETEFQEEVQDYDEVVNDILELNEHAEEISKNIEKKLEEKDEIEISDDNEKDWFDDDWFDDVKSTEEKSEEVEKAEEDEIEIDPATANEKLKVKLELLQDKVEVDEAKQTAREALKAAREAKRSYTKVRNAAFVAIFDGCKSGVTEGARAISRSAVATAIGLAGKAENIYNKAGKKAETVVKNCTDYIHQKSVNHYKNKDKLLDRITFGLYGMRNKPKDVQLFPNKSTAKKESDVIEIAKFCKRRDIGPKLKNPITYEKATSFDYQKAAQEYCKNMSMEVWHGKSPAMKAKEAGDRMINHIKNIPIKINEVRSNISSAIAKTRAKCDVKLLNIKSACLHFKADMLYTVAEFQKSTLDRIERKQKSLRDIDIELHSAREAQKDALHKLNAKELTPYQKQTYLESPAFQKTVTNLEKAGFSKEEAEERAKQALAIAVQHGIDIPMHNMKESLKASYNDFKSKHDMQMEKYEFEKNVQDLTEDIGEVKAKLQASAERFSSISEKRNNILEKAKTARESARQATRDVDSLKDTFKLEAEEPER